MGLLMVVVWEGDGMGFPILRLSLGSLRLLCVMMSDLDLGPGSDLEEGEAPQQSYEQAKQARMHYPTCPSPPTHALTHLPLDHNIKPTALPLPPQHRMHLSLLTEESFHLQSNPMAQRHVRRSVSGFHISTRAYLCPHRSS